MSNYWRAMCCAPRDGTLVIIPLSDFSGVEICHWGKNPEHDLGGPEYCWVVNDSKEWHANDDKAPGWIPCPHFGP